MPTRGSYAGDPAAGDVLTAANFKKLAGGWVGLDEQTSDAVTSGTTELTVHTLSTPLDNNRKIRVTFHCLRATQSVANDVFSVRIKWGAGPTQVGEMRLSHSSTNNDAFGDFMATFDNTSGAANYTIIVTAVRTAGTGTLTLAGTTGGASRWMLVEDIGSNS